MRKRKSATERRFPVGTEVTTTTGVTMTGVVVKPFFWRESTDGTYKPPEAGDLPVRWDDGTRGYVWKNHICPLHEASRYTTKTAARSALLRE